MKKAVAIILLIGSGVLGHMAYNEYHLANYGKDAINNSVLGSIVQVKKETPTKTWLLGLGSLVTFGVGVVLVFKK